MSLTLITNKKEMNYLKYSNILWDDFGFHIELIVTMLQNQAYYI